ncbi:MAG TPA: hypothetical protein VF933_03975, partial [Streptosporangiaceae bacterium]
LGSVAAVTAVVCAVVFGTSLDGLISHPVRYGRTWDVLIQAEGGYGRFASGSISRLLAGHPSVAGWSEFAFTQLRVGGRSFLCSACGASSVPSSRPSPAAARSPAITRSRWGQ